MRSKKIHASCSDYPEVGREVRKPQNPGHRVAAMADVDKSWQTKISRIRERTKFVFDNELMSDLKFVVPASSDGSARKKAKMVIPVHKFVLAMSSPVFYSMFYGQMAETSDSVKLPDCEYESLFEFFRYLYSDEVNLSGSNVMQVFYLAKKYMVPSLAARCSKYLRNNLEGSNVISVLLHAQKFEDIDLEERCWAVIKTQASKALRSDVFVTLERSLVEAVVKNERLFVEEVELFKAVDRWATKQIEMQGLRSDDGSKRQIIGEEIVKAIRFPLMSLKEFASVVPDCNILTMKEIVDMMKYYSDVLATPLPFIQTPRIGPLQRCFRYQGVDSPNRNGHSALFGWLKSHRMCVILSKAVFLHGVQLFGSKDGEYAVDVKVVEDVEDILTDCGFSLIEQSGRYISKEVMGNATSVSESGRGKKTGLGNEVGYGFDVMFHHPVCLESGKRYEIISTINGPPSWRGTGQMASVECAGVIFAFNRETDHLFDFNPVSSWQFPALIFSF